MFVQVREFLRDFRAVLVPFSGYEARKVLGPERCVCLTPGDPGGVSFLGMEDKTVRADGPDGQP